MITIYRSLMLIALIAVAPFAWIAALSGSTKWRERYVWYRAGKAHDLWIHAASVGEVKVASHLINYLLRSRREMNVVLTVVTDAGYRAACSEFRDRIMVRYLPVDSTITVRRAFERLRPRMIVITETEIWPNLILESKRRSLPLMLVNGRMSTKAARRYRWFASSVAQILACHEHFFYKAEEDALRYAEYGVGPERSTVAGDMKFDAPVLEKNVDRISRIRQDAGVNTDEFLFVAGSTRPGEEALLLQLYQRIHPKCPQFRLLIAPRHIDRTDEIRLLLSQFGVAHSIYREGGSDDSKSPVILVNRMGVLNDLYSAADLAFVGGTLVDIGGHNILEPVWTGTPVLFGPSISNVAEAAAYIELHQFGRKVNTPDDLLRVVLQVCSGELKFKIKTVVDYRQSPTALIGNYILKRLGNV